MTQMFSRFRNEQGIPVFARHTIVLLTLAILLSGGILGGRLMGAFAQGSCRAGDRVYTVNLGDTLSGIAARYHTTWQRLASYNHLPNPNLIFPAQTICIPSSSSQPSQPSSGGGLSRNQYVALARQDALNYGISADLFVRQINQESGFNPYAISPAGAIGIAQFMPGTAAALGINPHDPVASLRAAASLMANYDWTYHNYAKALAAYNAGPGAVQFAVYEGGSNWFVYLPLETQTYIQIIMG